MLKHLDETIAIGHVDLSGITEELSSQKNNGYLQKNLFDKTSITPNIKYTTTGTTVSDTNWAIELIKVEPSTKYAITSSTATGYFIEFDSSKAFIKGYVKKSQVITTSSNCEYLGVGIVINSTLANYDLDSFQIEKGEVATQYTDFGKSNAELTENISDIYDNGFASRNLFDEQMEVGGIDTTSGASVTYATRMRSVNYTEIDATKSYYICTQSTVSTSATKLRVFYYDSSKAFISFQDWTNELTIPSGAKYIRFITIDGYGTTYNNDIILNVSDSKNGTYQPYAMSNVVLAKKSLGYLKPNNLYDSVTMKLYHKSYDTSNGSLVDNSNTVCTTKISATPSTLYMVNNLGSSGVFRILYWNNDTYKGTDTRSDSNIFTVPSDVNKFAIQVGDAVYSDDMEISVATKSNTELTKELNNSLSDIKGNALSLQFKDITTSHFEISMKLNATQSLSFDVNGGNGKITLNIVNNGAYTPLKTWVAQ